MHKTGRLVACSIIVMIVLTSVQCGYCGWGKLPDDPKFTLSVYIDIVISDKILNSSVIASQLRSVIRKKFEAAGIKVFDAIVCDEYVLLIDVAVSDAVKGQNAYLFGVDSRLMIDRCAEPGKPLPNNFADGLRPLWGTQRENMKGGIDIIKKTVISISDEFIKDYQHRLD